MNTTRDSRFVGFLVVFTLGYVMMEATYRAAQERRAKFVAWRDAWMERYNRNPGHREFLRDVLMHEEMNIRPHQTALPHHSPASSWTSRSDDADCGCD